MSKTVKILDEFKINYLTQAQYDAEVAGGTVEPDELYLTLDSSASATQTLTNKTIDYADNTLTGVQPTLTAGTGIDITGTTISTKKTYSTNEVATGDVWVNGKPIYRKSYSFTTGTVTNNQKYILKIDSAVTGDEKLIKVYGCLDGSLAGIVPIPSTSTTSSIDSNITVIAGTFFIDGSWDTGLFLEIYSYNNASRFSSCPVYLTVEYFKD